MYVENMTTQICVATDTKASTLKRLPRNRLFEGSASTTSGAVASDAIAERTRPLMTLIVETNATRRSKTSDLGAQQRPRASLPSMPSGLIFGLWKRGSMSCCSSASSFSLQTPSAGGGA